MTIDQMVAFFDDHQDEFLSPDPTVPMALSQRADLNAFMLLDKLCPGTRDIIGGADHDQIFIGIEVAALAAAATDADLLTLMRCGVLYSKNDECLFMHV